MKVVLAKPLTCKRCQYSWRPRKEEVQICPRCKSTRWDKAKEDEK